MTTDLEAAAARLKRDLDAIAAETSGAKEARGDVRLLLADWERRRKDAEYAQNAVDTVIHYRNLAIKCGAAPDDMLGAYDRKLCVDHNPNDRDGYDFSGNRETWAEVEKVTAERDAARAEVERLCDWASKVIGDDGPDLDAYLDGHVATPNLARLRERDARVREAFRLIDWMAKEYAEAGGSDGPEMRTYNEALSLLKETP